MPKNDSLTPHAKKVLELLKRLKKPLTAYEILERLRDAGFRAPTTVYRALESLMKQGLIHRIEALNSFVACHHSHAEEAEHPSPFAVCTGCGAVEEVHDDALAHAVLKAAPKMLKRVSHRILEISGLCASCVAKVEGKR